MELWKIIPPEEGSDFCHRLVYHGRDVCNSEDEAALREMLSGRLSVETYLSKCIYENKLAQVK